MLRGGPMQTAWSAKRTWRLSRSPSEYTATVLTPSSRHAQMTRSAISPRLAIRIFLNTLAGREGLLPLRVSARRPDRTQRLSVLHRLPVLGVDPDDLARHLGLDLVHQLHRLDDAELLADADAVTHVHECRRAGIRRPIEGADDRALHR